MVPMTSQASGDFFSEYQGFARFDKDLHWSAVRMELEDIPWALAEFDLSVVGWLRSGDATKFWPPPVPRRRRGVGGRGAGPGRGDGAADAGSSSSDVPSDGTEQSSDHIDDPGRGPGPGWEIEIDGILEDLADHRRRAGGDVVPPDPGPPEPEPPPPPAPPRFPWEGPGIGDPLPPRVAAEDDEPHPDPPIRPNVRTGAPRYQKLWVHDEFGITIGYILVNARAKQLDAHCLVHGDACSCGRTWTAYEGAGRLTPLRAARGRCLAWLVAWLRLGCNYEAGAPGRDGHFGLSQGRGPWADILKDGKSEVRQVARVWVEAAPGLEPARKEERKPRAGEGLEPQGPF